MYTIQIHVHVHVWKKLIVTCTCNYHTCTCTCKLMNMYTMYSYMYANVHIHVHCTNVRKSQMETIHTGVHVHENSCMLAKGVEMINKQTQQTNSHPGLEK